MWQCCKCQPVVDSRLVVQRWRKLSNQKPSVIVVCRKGRLALNAGDVFQRGVILARPYQLSIQEHACTQFRASGCTVCCCPQRDGQAGLTWVVYVGAMENWGLVTYREMRLLVDPAQSSAAAKQIVALVVGHELAHQWFGNFVTMVSH